MYFITLKRPGYELFSTTRLATNRARCVECVTVANATAFMCRPPPP